jgi:D-alanyl-D-alanine carboxypeptidase (penicillin-binding protein 5/6)
VAGQSSSPYDLALIFRALLENPDTAAVLATPTAQMPAVGDRSPGYQIQSQNPLLGSYPGNLGGKNGFTDAARHTFVTAAERDGRRLVVSVMDTENVPPRAAEQAVLLLDWGFSVPRGTDGAGRLVRPADLAAATATPTTTARPRPSPVAGTGAAVADAGEPSPLVPASLAAGAVLIVAATVVGRRRAVRRPAEAPAVAPVRRPPPAGSPPPPSSASPSTRP